MPVTKKTLMRFISIRNSSPLASNLQFGFDAYAAGFDAKELGEPRKLEDGGYLWITPAGTLVEQYGTLHMAVFKPSKEEWNLIKEVAMRGAVCDGLPIRSPTGVQLECRENYNIEDGTMPCSINMMLTSYSPYTGCGDCDLNDRATLFTDEFRAAAPLNENDDGLFDFYIYNRYERGDGNLCGNILVEVRAGKLARIWIEGGNDWSWTPETGVSHTRLLRAA